MDNVTSIHTILVSQFKTVQPPHYLYIYLNLYITYQSRIKPNWRLQKSILLTPISLRN